MSSQSIISVKNLTYAYNSEVILEKVYFNIKEEDLVAVVGHNGSGKTTLIKILLGLIEPSKQAKISIKGKIAYIPQKFVSESNFPGKVREILDLECCDCSLRGEVVESLGLDNLEDKQFKNLSGGQQQRVMIALSLLSNPDILILDEPTVGVDTKTQENFYKLLKDLNKKRKLTILFVTHDTGMISEYFTKTICVSNKSVHIDDAKHTQRLLHKTYGDSFTTLDHHHGGHN